MKKTLKSLCLVLTVLSTSAYATRNTAPTITSTPVTTATQDSSYTYTLTGTDVDGDALTFSATTGSPLPSWLTLSSGVAVSTFVGSGSSGSADGTGTAASFYFPAGVAVDSSDNIYVADTFNNLIRKITSAGVVTTLAGTAGSSGSADGTGTAATFNYPAGVAVDSSGNVYVADKDNHLIRKITSAGVVTTLAGTAGSSGSANGNGTAATFNYPAGVAVDSSDNVYVAGNANPLIRKISTDVKLTGTPTNADVGVYDVNLTVSDGNGGTSTQNFQITVANVDDAPVLTALADVNVSEDFSDLSITLSASDIDGDSISYTADTNNSTLATVAIVNGHLIVTPVANANGTITVDVNATANGKSDVKTFILNVSSVDDAPILNTIANPADRNENFADFNITLGATDIEGDPYTITATSLDTSKATLTLTNNILIVHSVLNASGEVSIDINVTQDSNSSLQNGQNISFTVVQVNTPIVNTHTCTNTGETGVNAFVNRIYVEGLNRTPDLEGLAHWRDAIINGTDTPAGVVEHFTQSDEFIQKHSNDDDVTFLETLYRTFFCRMPDQSGLDYWLSQLESGKSRDSVIQGFIHADEFKHLISSYNLDTNNTSTPNVTEIGAFVSRMYTETLLRSAETQGYDYWVNQLSNQKKSASDIAKGFILSDEFIGRDLDNEAFLTVLYKAFLDRVPDTEGKTYWLTKLDNNTSRTKVLNGFLSSPEFTQLAEQYGLKAL